MGSGALNEKTNVKKVEENGSTYLSQREKCFWGIEGTIKWCPSHTPSVSFYSLILCDCRQVNWYCYQYNQKVNVLNKGFTFTPIKSLSLGKMSWINFSTCSLMQFWFSLETLTFNLSVSFYFCKDAFALCSCVPSSKGAIAGYITAINPRVC